MKRLEESKTWKRNSAEFREKTIERVLYHKKTTQAVIKEYEISSTSVLRSWIKKYNKGIQTKATGKGRVGATISFIFGGTLVVSWTSLFAFLSVTHPLYQPRSDCFY